MKMSEWLSFVSEGLEGQAVRFADVMERNADSHCRLLHPGSAADAVTDSSAFETKPQPTHTHTQWISKNTSIITVLPRSASYLFVLYYSPQKHRVTRNQILAHNNYTLNILIKVVSKMLSNISTLCEILYFTKCCRHVYYFDME